MTGQQRHSANLEASGFLRRLVLTLFSVFLFLAMLAVLATAAHILLVIFGGMLAATFIRTLSVPLHRLTRLPHGLAVVLTVLGFSGVLYLAGLYVTPRVAVQMSELQHRLPAAIDALQRLVREDPLGSELLTQLPDLGGLLKSQRVLQEVRGLFSVTLGVFADLFIFFFITVYLTFDPGVYLNGFLSLVPPPTPLAVLPAVPGDRG